MDKQTCVLLLVYKWSNASNNNNNNNYYYYYYKIDNFIKILHFLGNDIKLALKLNYKEFIIRKNIN